MLKLRSEILQAIRSFFIDRDFIEVETPIRIPAPALEPHIDAEPSGDYYLRTSPELHMKRLLAAGYKRIFQIGPCFRRDEKGDRHHPEYTMLEWYRAEADYIDILDETRDLFIHIAERLGRGTSITYQGQEIALDGIWKRIRVADAFVTHAGWDPVERFDPDRFDLDLIQKVEPIFPKDIPVIFMDYPVAQAALARRKKENHSVAERWELYIAGLELANAFSELTDAYEQLERFKACALQREKNGQEIYPVDEAFARALRQGIPPAGGIALGIDRLLMLFADAVSLDEVLPFR